MLATVERPLGLKWGTSSNTTPDGELDEARIDGYAAQVAEVLPIYKNVFIIASGSVAVGKCVWRESRGDEPFPPRQVLAMLGTAGAHNVWERALGRHGLLAG